MTPSEEGIWGTLASSKKRLRRVLMLFWAALLVPSVVLFYFTYARLEDEAFLVERVRAEETVQQLDLNLTALIDEEDRRSFDEYSFIKGDGSMSELATLFPPSQSRIPGNLGYFQIGPDGSITTPLLPFRDSAYPLLNPQQIRERRVVIEQISTLARDTLSNLSFASRHRPEPVIVENVIELQKKKDSYISRRESTPAESDVASNDEGLLASAPPAPAGGSFGTGMRSAVTAGAVTRDSEVAKLENAPQQQALDSLNIDSKLYDKQTLAGTKEIFSSINTYNQKTRRQENAYVPALEQKNAEKAASGFDQPEEERKDNEVDTAARLKGDSIDFRPVTVEIDPLMLVKLNDDRIAFVRRAWKSSERYLQGFIVDARTFFVTSLTSSDPTGNRSLVAGIDGAVFRDGQPEQKKQVLLLRRYLSAPFNRVEIIASTKQLPMGPASSLVNMVGIALLTILTAGLWLMYRLGARQLELARERSDFISAVSHELKTPLTSIRMYSEMLRENWVPDEEKKKSYYDFIFLESERLSRLIANVLLFSRIGKHGADLELTPHPAHLLLDGALSKVRAQAAQAGFTITQSWQPEPFPPVNVLAEEDAFCRIIINLVDNALKFAAGASRKEVIVGAEHQRDAVRFFVRDFGPGVDRSQSRKIFQLFYRPDGELTRKTSGTGIGLALIKELVTAMRGEIDLKNANPGAEFSFTVRKAD
jgi:two-component system, OmpR family, phosphate regulon sensor histidine kinase PhoR